MTDNPRIDDLRRRVQKDPASIAFAQLAEEYRRAGQFSEAVEVCRAGLAVHPGYLSARVTLGRALVELGRARRGAARVRDGACRAHPRIWPPSAVLAKIHQPGSATCRLRSASYRDGACRSLPNDPDLEETVGELDDDRSKRAVRRHLGRRRDTARRPLVTTPEAEQDRAVRTVSALEQWLAAIHVTRADRRS